MKYFIDFEFIEGFHKPLFGKKRHFIDLVSVGVVSGDGKREYYAISTDFNPKDADAWVKNNVLSKLPPRRVSYNDSSPRQREETLLWKSNKQIAQELLGFFGCEREDGNWYAPEGIEIYGYYADYDWVLLCSLFGRMIDLPKNFPMYCRDLKQILDEKATLKIMEVEMKYEGETRFETSLRQIKNNTQYPKQKDEHNAIADARWNHELYKFLQTL